MPATRQTKNSCGLFAGCGRYGYSNNGSGEWINAKKLIQKEEKPVEQRIFEHLLAILKTRSRKRGEDLIERYIENEIIPDELLLVAIDALPAK